MHPFGDDLLCLLFAHQTASIVNTIGALAVGSKWRMRTVEDYLLRFDRAVEEPEAAADPLAAFDRRFGARMAEGA